MPRKRLTLERTERVTIEEHEDTAPLAWAPGWDGTPPGAFHRTGSFYRAQRAGQVERCEDFLALWSASVRPRVGWDVNGGYSSAAWPPTVDPDGGYNNPGPERLIAEAAIILRAGPNATPSELYLGRTV